MLRMWHKRYGRMSDWVVLSEDGTEIGMLSDWRWSGDFFHDYRLSIMAEDSCIRESLLNASFWREHDHHFENVDFGDVVRAFATADLDTPLSIRTQGLVIDERAPSLLDELVLAVGRP